MPQPIIAIVALEASIYGLKECNALPSHLFSASKFNTCRWGRTDMFWFLSCQMKFHFDDIWVLLNEEELGKASYKNSGETLKEQESILFPKVSSASLMGCVVLHVMHKIWNWWSRRHMGILKVLNEEWIQTLLSVCNRIKHCEVYTGVSFFFLCMLWSL